MGLLFQRTSRITFGRKGEVGKQIQGLRATFEGEKNSSKNSNKFRVDIYNLNPDSRGRLQEDSKNKEKRLVFIFEVGYDSGLEVLFSGDVIKAISTRKGNEWVTTVELGDGEVDIKGIKYNKTFAPGASTDQVIKDVAKDLGKGIAAIKGTVVKAFQQGISFSGTIEDALDKVTDEAEVEWSVQDDQLQILGEAEDLGDIGLVIKKETGLIGSPSLKADGGVEFDSLLIPSLKPDKKVFLNSNIVEGFYKIRKVTYSGDTKSGPWFAKCECSKIKTDSTLTTVDIDTTGLFTGLA